MKSQSKVSDMSADMPRSGTRRVNTAMIVARPSKHLNTAEVFQNHDILFCYGPLILTFYFFFYLMLNTRALYSNRLFFAQSRL